MKPRLSATGLLAPVLGLLLAGLVACRPAEGEAKKSSAAADGQEKIDPAERPFLDAARPFYTAVAAGKYAEAYGQLSSHARARMTAGQFKAAEDDAEAARLNATVHPAVDAAKFAELMRGTVQAYGIPIQLLDLAVFETDPKVLGGQATDAEDRIAALFAIGNMPASVPAAIRRASLRGKLRVELSVAQLAEIAKAHEMTPEKLKADPDFAPYVTLKVVLVEEAGALKVGYFEFVPPSMMD